ncbi:MAG: YdcF family protein [Oscillospiraceae bacterium]|nr:YdcF family protein [Oscillospiraceae bacterium]
MSNRLLWHAAAACAVLGMLCARVPGMRFSVLLAWCACAALIVYAALCLLAPRAKWAKWAKRVLLALFAVGLVFFAGLEALILSASKPDADRSPVSCVIVLGAGVNGTEPSLMLQSRLDRTLDYIADKPDIPVIVTGSRGQGEDISEAECMYRYLTAHGVDGSRVWKEEQATSTRTNFARSYELMAERGVSGDFAVVTSDYHVCRALRLADTPAARGVAARLPRGAYYDALTVNYYVREAFALANELFLRMDLDV